MVVALGYQWTHTFVLLSDMARTHCGFERLCRGYHQSAI